MSGVFHRGKAAEPFLLVHAEELEPPAQLGKGDRKASAEPLHGGKAQEILRQDTEEEEEAVAGVGDNEIWEDGMGMSAGTDEAQDAEAVADGCAAYEIDQGAVIIGMNAAGSLCPTAGTGLEFGVEPLHKGSKEGFR